MSPRIAVVYAGELEPIAKAFANGARGLDAETRVYPLRTSGDQTVVDEQTAAFNGLLRWCDGIALGTPSGPGVPASVLVELVEQTRADWEDGRLMDKTVTVFSDHPERRAADALIFPLYVALYHWGAVVVGPKDFELPGADGTPHAGERDPRQAAAEYRGRRLTRLAGVIAAERSRRAQLEL